MSSELRQYLQGVLAELDKLEVQIRQTHDISESAEMVLCLKELVQEQIERPSRENPGNSARSAG